MTLSGNGRSNCFCSSGDTATSLRDALKRKRLVDWTLRHDRGPWFERDGAKGVLILEQVLLQQTAQCLGLLWAEVNRLEGVDGDLLDRFLVGGAEGKAEVPHAFLHLHAVGITLAIIGRSLQNALRLRSLLAHA